MRIDIQFDDRVGIAHEILAVLAERRLNVVAVEVQPPHTYIDAPALTGSAFHALRQALAEIPGVRHAQAVDMLPGARRTLHLNALLSALADPVLAVDADGAVVVANAAAAAAAGVAETALCGASLAELLGDPALQHELIDSGFRAPLREVSLRDEPFLLDVTPIRERADGAVAAGGVITLHSPSRIGERLDAMQHYSAGSFESIIGESAPMLALKARGARMAGLNAPVLILGETGTGKELIAHACHHGSARRSAPFLALNCAALPESLAESELFGYAPGAFSGAQKGGKPGLLELAHHGTVFLDEIGEMSPYLQAKLLRFLNDGSFRRVGAERERSVDVRVISATHRDLEQMVGERSFREDLYYRLNVLNIDVPPLRSRGNDIVLLARHFIERSSAQAQRVPPRLSPAANAALLANPWPGNVRQLANVIFRAVTMSDKACLDACDLDLADARSARAGSDGDAATGWEAGWEAALVEFERGLLGRLYPRFPSSRKLAAQLKTSHTMIANKLRKYGIPERR